MVTNICYSASSDSTAFHVVTVFRRGPEKKSLVPPKGANGISKEESELELTYMHSWKENVLNDTLAL